MVGIDPIDRLKAFIDERWTVIQPRCFPHASKLSLRLDVTSNEAQWFLACVEPHGCEPPLLRIEDDNKLRSRRYPPNANSERGNAFFEAPRRDGPIATLRDETIVHLAAVWRLHDEFKWPLTHLVIESPDVHDDHHSLSREALDILALDEPYDRLPSKVTSATLQTHIGVEVKASSELLDKLLRGIDSCHEEIQPGHAKEDHRKCRGIEVFRPRLFLAVAGREDWRLFGVDTKGRALFNDRRDLVCLRFNRP